MNDKDKMKKLLDSAGNDALWNVPKKEKSGSNPLTWPKYSRSTKKGVAPTTLPITILTLSLIHI